MIGFDGGSGPLLRALGVFNMSWVELNREILKACVQHDRQREEALRRLALEMSLALHRNGQAGVSGTTIVR